jgi:hypothetical protein
VSYLLYFTFQISLLSQLRFTHKKKWVIMGNKWIEALVGGGGGGAAAPLWPHKT